MIARADPDEVHRERLDALVGALLSLPARQRQALVMREFEGRSYDEIATRLGASNGAVRQLLNRARTSIRERLGALIPVDFVAAVDRDRVIRARRGRSASPAAARSRRSCPARC